MSKIEVNTVAPQCGTTLTLGESGDTVTLGSGASQSGFGRTGTVDWQTTIKTGDFTAANGEGYFVNTTSGPITMTLPSSPSVGDIVAVKDYANTFDTHKLTIGRNGSNIAGEASDGLIAVEGQALTLIYGDATKGWQVVYAATEADLPKPAFVTATGGTETTVCTNFKVHTFTGPGTFTVTCAGNSGGSTQVDYLVIAGGGGGGGGYQSGGGGAGGYRESPGSASGCYTASPRGAAPAAAITVIAQAYPIVVGAGGPGGPATPGGSPGYGVKGTSGNVSSALGIQSAAGGFGATFNNTSTLHTGTDADSFGVGTDYSVNGNYNYVHYVFREVKGYSKFGQFAGNSNSSGSFVYCGFKPALIFIKRRSNSGGWYMYNHKSSPTNMAVRITRADIPDEEDVNNQHNLDIYSTGFKILNTNGGQGGATETYFMAAFAERPFVTSSGVPTVAR